MGTMNRIATVFALAISTQAVNLESKTMVEGSGIFEEEFIDSHLSYPKYEEIVNAYIAAGMAYEEEFVAARGALQGAVQAFEEDVVASHHAILGEWASWGMAAGAEYEAQDVDIRTAHAHDDISLADLVEEEDLEEDLEEEV